MKKVAIAIIIVGLALMIFSAFTYFTREKVVDLGKVEITTSKPHKLNWSPFVGVAVMGVGGVLLIISNKK
jgi:hypothetical protein